MFFAPRLRGALAIVSGLGMEVSCRICHPCFGVSDAGEREKKRAGYRSTMRGLRAELEGPSGLVRRLGFEGVGGGAHYPPGCRSVWLRTIAIFALIHQPILPLSLVALGRSGRGFRFAALPPWLEACRLARSSFSRARPKRWRIDVCRVHSLRRASPCCRENHRATSPRERRPFAERVQ